MTKTEKAARMAPEPPFLIITREQLQQGWIEMRGVKPIVIHTLQNGNLLVRNPRLQVQG